MLWRKLIATHETALVFTKWQEHRCKRHLLKWLSFSLSSRRVQKQKNLYNNKKKTTRKIWLASRKAELMRGHRKMAWKRAWTDVFENIDTRHKSSYLGWRRQDDKKTGFDAFPLSFVSFRVLFVSFSFSQRRLSRSDGWLKRILTTNTL